eukprot:408860_1
MVELVSLIILLLPHYITALVFGFRTCYERQLSNDSYIVTTYWGEQMFECSVVPNASLTLYICDSANTTNVKECYSTETKFGLQISNVYSDDVCVNAIYVNATVIPVAMQTIGYARESMSYNFRYFILNASGHLQDPIGQNVLSIPICDSINKDDTLCGLAMFDGLFVENGVHPDGFYLVDVKNGRSKFLRHSETFQTMTRTCDGDFYQIGSDSHDEAFLTSYNPSCSLVNRPGRHYTRNYRHYTAIAYNQYDGLLYVIVNEGESSYHLFTRPSGLFTSIGENESAEDELQYVGFIAHGQSLNSLDFDSYGNLYSWSSEFGLIQISYDHEYETPTIIKNLHNPNVSGYTFNWLSFDPMEDGVAYAGYQQYVFRINVSENTLTDMPTPHYSNISALVILNQTGICRNITDFSCGQSRCPEIYINKQEPTYEQSSSIVIIIVMCIGAVIIVIATIVCIVKRWKPLHKRKRKSPKREIVLHQMNHNMSSKNQFPFTSEKNDSHYPRSTKSAKFVYKDVAPSAPDNDLEIEKKTEIQAHIEGENEGINEYHDVKMWFDQKVDMNEHDKMKYFDLFIDHGFENLTAIRNIKQYQLEKIGVKLGHINIIMSAVQQL